MKILSLTMDTRPHPPVYEEELHALLDGRLDAVARTALLERLAQDREASATLESWRRQREALRSMHGDVLQEPIPASLLATAGQTQQAHQQMQQWSRWGGMAAGLFLAFGLGWLMHGQWLAPAGALQARQQPVREFVHQAALAHAVYAPEVRHPVEVSSAQEEHLVQWLSKRLGRPLKLPRLNEQGYELVGGRLLPGDEGARAQFMYQNARGERVTLYLGSTPGGVGAAGGGAEFRYSTEGPVPGFYWVDEGFAYALSGTLTRPQLLQLAQAVYHQL